MLKTLQKIIIAAFGFILGLITAPLAAVLWPFASAYLLLVSCFMDDDDGDVIADADAESAED